MLQRANQIDQMAIDFVLLLFDSILYFVLGWDLMDRIGVWLSADF